MQITTKDTQKLLNVIRRNHNVLAVALVGSVPQRSFDDWSDVDIYVLIDKKIGKKRMQTHIRGISVDIIYNTKKEAFSYLFKEQKTTHRNTAHMIAHGQLFWEKTPVWSKVQSIAKNVLSSKTRMEKEQILMHIYSINDYITKAARASAERDAIAYALSSQFVVQNSLELILAFRHKYWLPIRQMDQLIESIDPEFHKLLLLFYKKNKSTKSYDTLCKLAKHAVHVAGGPLPSTWSIKR